MDMRWNCTVNNCDEFTEIAIFYLGLLKFPTKQIHILSTQNLCGVTQHILRTCFNFFHSGTASQAEPNSQVGQAAHTEDQIEEENWRKMGANNRRMKKIRKCSSLAHPRLKVWLYASSFRFIFVQLRTFYQSQIYIIKHHRYKLKSVPVTYCH